MLAGGSWYGRLPGLVDIWLFLLHGRGSWQTAGDRRVHGIRAGQRRPRLKLCGHPYRRRRLRYGIQKVALGVVPGS